MVKVRDKHGILFLRVPTMPTLPTRICYILDMDGYTFGGVFHAREISLTDVGSSMTRTWHLAIDENVLSKATKLEMKSATYVFKNVFGISLRSHPDAFVGALTTTFEIGGCGVSSLSADGIVGYKGGTIERQLLMEIGMYRYEIGALECPKTDVVLAAMGAVGRLGDPCHECARYQRYRKDGKFSRLAAAGFRPCLRMVLLAIRAAPLKDSY